MILTCNACDTNPFKAPHDLIGMELMACHLEDKHGYHRDPGPNSISAGGHAPPVGPSQFDTIEEERGER